MIGVAAAMAGNPLGQHPPPAPAPSHTGAVASPGVAPGGPPVPLLAADKPVDWWFAYKFSASEFRTDDTNAGRACPFGGSLRHDAFSQTYAVASSANPVLTDGPGLIGTSAADPLGATFAKIYQGRYYFVVWNDQFYNDPPRNGPACAANQCGSPWGHSKGVVAWDTDGNGVILQVTTPSWPAAGGSFHPRADGNTLGCVANDNNASNAQDFFALKLSRDDLKAVLRGLAVASVSTDVANPQIVNTVVDGTPLPQDLAALVTPLGKVSNGKAYVDQTLSSGIRMIVKPSALHVPPWQFVSSVLGGEPLLTATWWANPPIASTRPGRDVYCWDASLTRPPGEVDVALAGAWDGVETKFTGGPNHAKIGVSLPGGAHHYAIFGDLNQQGQLGSKDAPNGPKCGSSQNGRGGMFFVADNPTLAAGVARLITGKVAPYPKQ
ncbi:MAG: deoxyribonuclease II family protein [Phenylobacterium sp.]